MVNRVMLCRRSDVIWRTAPNYLVLMDSQGDLMEISGSVVLAWELLAEPIEFDELVSQIASTYDAPSEDVAPVLEAVIDSLQERGVVDQLN